MAKFIEKALVATALATSFSSATAASPSPVLLCVVDAKNSRATIYDRVDGFTDYRTAERTVRGVLLEREVGVVESSKNLWHRVANKVRDEQVKPQTVRIAEGVVGEYSARSEMYLPNEKAWAEKYEGSITVSVNGWKGAQAVGYCGITSGVTGDTSGIAPIVPASSLTMQRGIEDVNIFTYKP